RTPSAVRGLETLARSQTRRGSPWVCRVRCASDTPSAWAKSTSTGISGALTVSTPSIWHTAPSPPTGRVRRPRARTLHQPCTNPSPPPRRAVPGSACSRDTIGGGQPRRSPPCRRAHRRRRPTTRPLLSATARAKDHRGDLGSDRARPRSRRDARLLGRARAAEAAGRGTGPQARVRRPDPGARPHAHAGPERLLHLPPLPGLRLLQLLAGHPARRAAAGAHGARREAALHVRRRRLGDARPR